MAPRTERARGTLFSLILLASVVLMTTRAAAATPLEADPDADDEIPRPLIALAAGGGLSLVSLGTAAVAISRSSNQAVHNVALLGAQSGLTLAPVLSHALVGETKRGLLFATVPIAAEAAMATLLAVQPSLITFSPKSLQAAYVVVFSVSLVGATLGTADAVYVGERKRTTLKSQVKAIWGAPMLGQGGAGVMIGGSL
jgi:hypothetical protein